MSGKTSLVEDPAGRSVKTSLVEDLLVCQERPA